MPPSLPTRRAAVRPLGALAAAVLLTVIAAPAATAAGGATSTAPATKLPAGLFGTADPTYDGVFRQSTALLALSAAGVTPATAAVNWLTGQQCADGGFGAFRASTAKPCARGGEDTNSTAMAVQALSSFGGDPRTVTKAVGWLKSAQNKDGGWGYQAGAGSDPDSTAVVAGALQAAGVNPDSLVKAGQGPLQSLLKLQLGCGAKAAQRGAFAYQPDKNGKLAANDKATTDGILALHDEGYLVRKPAADSRPKAMNCPSAAAGRPGDANSAASAAAAYLAADLAGNGDHLVAARPGAAKPAADPGTTAYAVIALAGDGQLTDARAAYRWLESDGTAWAASSPAALGALVLAAHAVGANPHLFGSADLVSLLSRLGPANSSGTTKATVNVPDHRSSSSLTVWWIIGVCLLAGIGVGIAMSTRNKKRA
ncbi:prenyltransferase/squalene oxidase repeat-containing protein [Streptantibioticus silvisoli]|uniref:Prenyltransferase/squalene oxidase repeat-containing protein n=1 Tax=Streptantibioticus silvisoli TaxID=2705255 RepID=A0ABT6VSW2_9ACTN|nr:prenyltransferase/squalene oxidase repeat-containing protein [Streptantibioticus silvisoli]MDI5961565.1 prenyltransferase/squalene oxidase repeat-containing protein [Streptantibioticus silvisoli]